MAANDLIPPKFVIANLREWWSRLCPKADLEDAEEGQKMANTACTGRWGVCGTLRVEHFPRFEFFLLPSRVPVRPSAMLRERKPLGGLKENEI